MRTVGYRSKGRLGRQFWFKNWGTKFYFETHFNFVTWVNITIGQLRDNAINDL